MKRFILHGCIYLMVCLSLLYMVNPDGTFLWYAAGILVSIYLLFGFMNIWIEKMEVSHTILILFKTMTLIMFFLFGLFVLLFTRNNVSVFSVILLCIEIVSLVVVV